MFLLDERILADGTHVKTHARVDGDRIHISDDAVTRDGPVDGALSLLAIDRVMVRYGRELESELLVGDTVDPARISDVLVLPDGHRLVRMRYHAVVDATGRDYLVWERPGGAPLAVVATMATAALRYLVLRLTQDASGI